MAPLRRLPGLPAQTALTLSGGPAMEHLSGVCEQSATICLMATHCVPKNGAIYMALKGSEHASTMLDQVEQAGRALLALVMPSWHFFSDY